MKDLISKIKDWGIDRDIDTGNSLIQSNIFEMISPTFKFDKDKPIKVFEAFSGVGMQLMALNRLGVEYESVGYSEIDKYAIQSYQAIHNNTNNFGDIAKIKGTNLPHIDLFTYSFPCTDLSKAGKQKGLNDTRSGLVYEVLRILRELKQDDNLPKVLLMENVIDLVQSKFIKQFNEIQGELEELGYSNHTEVLNALDYGVAQNRQRVFMISILGNYYYEFPKKIKLEKRLKDYLQPLEEIDKKYYLSDKALATFTDDTDRNGYIRSERFNPQTREANNAFCVTTREACVPTANYIIEKNGGVIIPEATKQGYAIANEGDSVNLEHPNSTTRRGRVGEQQAQTLTTSCNQGVVINAKTELCNKMLECGHLEEFDMIRHSYTASRSEDLTRKENKNNISATLTTRPDTLGVVTKDATDDYIIRKLTPLECWRLMGIDDSDFYKAESVCSNSQLYKQAGNGIVVDVLAAIFSKLY